VTKQSSLEEKEDALLVKKKCHNIDDWPKEEASKQICQNQRVRFGKSDSSVSVENF
jgi:hypothetical protein